uniref:Methylcytosine dioxygenase TET n=2 Tax=Octopus bimaculoides TaxID=37653 RepID=A0A0L8HF41_OCTBM
MQSPRTTLPMKDNCDNCIVSSSCCSTEKNSEMESSHINNELQSIQPEMNHQKTLQSQGYAFTELKYVNSNQLQNITSQKNVDDIREENNLHSNQISCNPRTGTFDNGSLSEKGYSPDSDVMVRLRENLEVNTSCEQSLISTQSNSAAVSSQMTAHVAQSLPPSVSYENMLCNEISEESVRKNPLNMPCQLSESRKSLNTDDMLKSKRLKISHSENSSSSSSHIPPSSWPAVTTGMLQCPSSSVLSLIAPVDMSIDRTQLCSSNSNVDKTLIETSKANNVDSVIVSNVSTSCNDLSKTLSMNDQIMKPTSNLPYCYDKSGSSSQMYRKEETDSNVILSDSQCITRGYSHESSSYSVSSKDDLAQNILSPAQNVVINSVNSDVHSSSTWVPDSSQYNERGKLNQPRASARSGTASKPRTVKSPSYRSQIKATKSRSSLRNLPPDNRLLSAEHRTQSALNDSMFNSQLQLSAFDPLPNAMNLTTIPANIASTNPLQQPHEYMQYNKVRFPPKAHSNISNVQYGSHASSRYGNIQVGDHNVAVSFPEHASKLKTDNVKQHRYLPHHLLGMPLISAKPMSDHVCSASNIVTPQYTSSIYTCAANKTSFSSSTLSNQSKHRTFSTFPPPPPPYPKPPSYEEVVKNMVPASIKKEDFLSDQQYFGSSRKSLWQPFTEGNANMIQVKTEPVSDIDSSVDVATSSSLQPVSLVPLPTFRDTFSSNSKNSQMSMSSNQMTIPSSHSVNNYQTLHPSSSSAHISSQSLPKSQCMDKVKLAAAAGSNTNSDLKPLNAYTPEISSDNNTQFKLNSMKIETDKHGNPLSSDVKCKFSINNSNFTDSNFQSAFLNSCPQNTKIPSEKMTKISDAFNSTVKHIFNNKYSADTKKNSCYEGKMESNPQVKTEPQEDTLPQNSTDDNTKENNDGANLFNRLKANIKVDIPDCGCLGPGYVPSEAVEGPFYTHLGVGSSLEEVKKIMENRTGLSGEAVRVEKIIYTGKEGKSSQGCPIAKWIVRRSGVEEKVLCLVRHRQGHFCETACLIICVVAWEGIPNSIANEMYSYLVPTLTEFGLETDRRCGYNEQKTCACQGMDIQKRGASFSFGCSWSMYFNGCKFARSKDAKKFRLKDTVLDEVAENKFQSLATRLAPLYKSVAPESYNNQVFFEDSGYECRLGYRDENSKPSRPFSGVTACVDFCAHSHKDLHNMNNGCTVVVTLTKHGPLEKPAEEQLHVLPLYILDLKDKNFEDKLKKGCVEILSNYPKYAHVRASPVTPKRKGKNKKDSPSNKRVNSRMSSPRKATFLNSKNANLMSQAATNAKSNLCSNLPQNAMANISGYKNIVNKINLLQNSTVNNISSSSSPSPSSAASALSSTAPPQASLSSPSSSSSLNTSLSSSSSTPLAQSSSFKVGSVEESNKNSNDQSVNNAAPLKPPTNAQSNNENTYNQFCKYLYSHGTFPPANFLKDGDSEAIKMLTSQSAAIGKDGLLDPSLHQQFRNIDLPKTYEGLKKMSTDVLLPTGSVCNVPFVNSNVKDSKRPFSASSLTSDDFESPLHLLSEAVMIRSQTAVEKSRTVSPQSQAGVNISTPRKPAPNTELSAAVMGAANQNAVNFSNHLSRNSCSNANIPLDLSKDQHSRLSSLSSNFDRKDIFDKVNSNLCQTSVSSYSPSNSKNLTSTPSLSTPFLPADGSMADSLGHLNANSTELISSELEFNEQNFRDPDIGGVAIALTHGSVLFEVAKRELHATTALLNPNRFSPTRISLVFYQHKSMNLRYHGWYENERKLELQRQKRLQKMKEETNKNIPLPSEELKPGSKKRRKKEETTVAESPAQYKYMWETAIKHTVTRTTDTVITQSIDPQPTVTGPYQKWICQ